MALFFFGLLFLIYSLNSPLTILTGAGHDDALFWKRALEIIKGNWLGDYGELTLAKGPTFSFFIAINALIGLPISLSIALLTLITATYILTVLKKFNCSDTLCLIIFIALLFHPAMIPTRIIRDEIYAQLTLLTIFGFFDLLLFPKIRIPFVKSFMIGIAASCFIMCREESLWIIPSILFAVIIILKNESIQNIKTCLKGVSFSLFIIFLSVFTVSSINLYKYDFFAID